jgi:hypothetical protein
MEGPIHLWPHSSRGLAGEAKFFKLEIGGCHETVRVDCLKSHLGLAPVVFYEAEIVLSTVLLFRIS